MAPQKFFTINEHGVPYQRPATDHSLGSDSAGQIIATGTDGRIHPSFLPTNYDGATLAPSAVEGVSSEPLSAGDWVNLYSLGGVRAVRRGLASSTLRIAGGFVVESYAAGVPVTVFLDGINAAIPKASFTANDLNKNVFLSAAGFGLCVLGPPAAIGNVIQPLGKIVEVGSTLVSVELDFGWQIVIDSVSVAAPAGPAQGDKSYTHLQTTAATIWAIPHNLGKYPSVIMTRMVNGERKKFDGDVFYIDINTVEVRFSQAIAGEAYCN